MAALALILVLALAAPSASANPVDFALGGGMMGNPVHHHSRGGGMHHSGTGRMMESRPGMPDRGHHDGGWSAAALVAVFGVAIAALAVVAVLVRRTGSGRHTPSTP